MRLERILSLKCKGTDVSLLQEKLKQLGNKSLRVDGFFGQDTLIAVTQFQKSKGIKPDGLVGKQTWSQMLKELEQKAAVVPPKPQKPVVESNKDLDIPNKISFIGEDGLTIYDNLLTEEEYYKKDTQKNTIWLHHTAGGSRPDWTIGGWEKDFSKDENGQVILDDNGNPKPLRVGTHFVIGRKSSSSDDKLWDGKILKAFDDTYWSYHLGINHRKSLELNSKSIGIEICNYGPLKLKSDGKFYNWVNKPINSSDVVELSKPFRGYKYWEKYTDLQLENCRKLIMYLQMRWNIEIPKGIYNEDWFEYDEKWFSTGGLRTHTQVRKDKFDLFPQPELIQMLNSI